MLGDAFGIHVRDGTHHRDLWWRASAWRHPNATEKRSQIVIPSPLTDFCFWSFQLLNGQFILNCFSVIRGLSFSPPCAIFHILGTNILSTNILSKHSRFGSKHLISSHILDIKMHICSAVLGANIIHRLLQRDRTSILSNTCCFGIATSQRLVLQMSISELFHLYEPTFPPKKTYICIYIYLEVHTLQT